MVKNRSFRVVFVAENHGVGATPAEKPDAVVSYTGTATTILAR